MSEPTLITSRANPLVKELHRLAHDNAAYRKLGRFWIEGEHLCRAALVRGLRPAMVVVMQSQAPALPADLRAAAGQCVQVADPLFREISGLESPAAYGCLMDLPSERDWMPRRATVVLDRLQDSGNVGSILRSAAAFGFRQVIALRGCAALWSPKVLRAGMGAHFGLQLFEGVAAQVLDGLELPLVVTSSHQGDLLQNTRLPHPCAWVLGHEGQGVSDELLAKAQLHVRIGQPGGEESLNVAAAAAICLHASSLRAAP